MSLFVAKSYFHLPRFSLSGSQTQSNLGEARKAYVRLGKAPRPHAGKPLEQNGTPPFQSGTLSPPTTNRKKYNLVHFGECQVPQANRHPSKRDKGDRQRAWKANSRFIAFVRLTPPTDRDTSVFKSLQRCVLMAFDVV